MFISVQWFAFYKSFLVVLLINRCPTSCFILGEFVVVFKYQFFFSTFREGLGEGYDGDIAFASALETFGGGHNDPISVAFGGMQKGGAYIHIMFGSLKSLS